MHVPILLALLATSAFAVEFTVEVTNAVQCTRKTKAGDSISVDYRGTLPNGEEFDSSYKREPIEFILGIGRVIQGYALLSYSSLESTAVQGLGGHCFRHVSFF